MEYCNIEKPTIFYFYFIYFIYLLLTSFTILVKRGQKTENPKSTCLCRQLYTDKAISKQLLFQSQQNLTILPTFTLLNRKNACVLIDIQHSNASNLHWRYTYKKGGEILPKKPRKRNKIRHCTEIQQKWCKISKSPI